MARADSRLLDPVPHEWLVGVVLRRRADTDMARYQPGRLPVRQCLRPNRRLRADVVAAPAHLPAVLIGLRWLYDTEQPSGSAIDPRCNSLPSTRECRSLRFSLAGRDSTVVIEIVGSVLNGSRDRALAAAELSAFGELVDGLGEEIVDSWTGRGRVIGGVALGRPAHPSLRAAVDRFQAGQLGSAPAISLTAVQRAMLDREVSIQQFAGPWPEALDPSGVLRRVASEAVAELALGARGTSRS
jgi:hypothetical protein